MKQSQTDIPILEFAQRIADALKADFMAVMEATDWEKTDPFVRAQAEVYLSSIDDLARDISVTVRRLDKTGNKIRARLQRRPAITDRTGAAAAPTALFFGDRDGG